MALRNIVIEGDPILRKKCRPVESVDGRIREILGDMLETMRAAQGVGIAAPQVGIMRRMFVAEPEPGRVYYMINPEILETEGSEDGEEGCLSVPGYAGTVQRPTFLRIRATGLSGEEQTLEFHGFDARVMLHENDHLDGILYIDKAQDIHRIDYDGEEFDEE